MIGVFLQYVGTQLATGNYASMHDAFIHAKKPEAVDAIRVHFMQHGFDGEVVNATMTQQLVNRVYDVSCKPLRTFADMQECRRQYEQGLVTEGELLLALQMTPLQVDAVIAYNRLPYKVQAKHSLSDWDEDVALRTERGDIPGRC